MHPGHPGAGSDEPDEPADDEPTGALLPPEDRVWRHPSELYPAPAPRASARGGLLATWAVALVSGLIGSVLTIGMVAAAGGFSNDGAGPMLVRETVAPPVPIPANFSDPAGVVAIAERVAPAILRVSARTPAGTSSGSGVVFRSDGHVLTNAHVVDGARSITVVLSSGDEHDAELVGADPVTDIAVLRIQGEGDGPYPTAVLGTATYLKPGQAAIAIGSPLGLVGGPSVTVGVVSAIGRRVQTQDGPTLLDMIQTDAPIASGSSGGALLDGRGAVIGITTAVAVSGQGTEGFGFATPVDIARDVADEIIATGRAVHVWMGVHGSDVDRVMARQLGIKGGALVQEVIAGTPADTAGLREGDVVVSVAGRSIESISELVVTLRSFRPGERVPVVYLRDGRRSEVTVTLAERPADL